MHRESIDVRFIQVEIQTRRGATTFRSGPEGSCPGSRALEGFAVVLLQPASFHGGKGPETKQLCPQRVCGPLLLFISYLFSCAM